MLRDTRECVRKIIEGNETIIMMEDVKCKEVCWEGWNTKVGEESWRATMLNLVVMSNIMTLWTDENTRFRENEEPSILNLQLTKEHDVIEKNKLPVSTWHE